MTSPSWVSTSRRQRTSAMPSSGGPWTVAIVVGLLWPATPTCAVYVVNVSSSESAEEQQLSQSTSRCSPVSQHVLWTRLKLAAPPRLTTLARSVRDDDDDAVVSGTQLSPPVSDYEPSQSFPSDISQTAATSTGSRHHQQRRHGRDRRRRRRQRSERLRRRDRDGSEPSTAWSCLLQKRWKRMSPDVFPRYIQTGSCRKQQTCMLGVYACRPRRYSVKVLRRVAADGCRPVPVAGPDVVYEEAWSLVDVPVTVACECSRRRRSGTYHHRPTGT